MNIKLRVKFSKHGALKFIGHLDVMRYFQKNIRRAEIDVAYTGGFSPHQIMTFAAPLGVGLESNAEYMDIEVNSITSCEDVKNALNRTGVPQIHIEDVTVLPPKAANAMASVYSAEYTVSFRSDRRPTVDLGAAIEKFMAKDSVMITKETKKGSREVDLRPGIYRFTYNPETDTMNMLLDASSSNNIKPIQVIEAMLADYDMTPAENALLITREDVYTNTGTEEAPVQTSLGAVGSHEIPAREAEATV